MKIISTKQPAYHLELNQPESAMTKGGIDLNAANVDFMIKRDGKGIILPFLQQDIGMLNSIEGFVPNIIEIRPFIVQPVIRHSNDGGIKIKHLLTNA